MKLKKLPAILFFIGAFFLFSSDGFAAAEVSDPDLKLSIEELKNKYPIDWFKRKYGQDACGSDEICDEEKCDLIRRGNLVCGFTNDRIKIKKGIGRDGYGRTIYLKLFEDLNESQIKSIILNHDTGDSRTGYIITIMLDEFAKSDDLANPLKNKIKQFFYSDTVLYSIRDLSCEALGMLDSNSEIYKRLITEYIDKRLGKNLSKSEYLDKYLDHLIEQGCVTKQNKISIKNLFVKPN